MRVLDVPSSLRWTKHILSLLSNTCSTASGAFFYFYFYFYVDPYFFVVVWCLSENTWNTCPTTASPPLVPTVPAECKPTCHRHRRLPHRHRHLPLIGPVKELATPLECKPSCLHQPVQGTCVYPALAPSSLSGHTEPSDSCSYTARSRRRHQRRQVGHHASTGLQCGCAREGLCQDTPPVVDAQRAGLPLR